MNIFVDGDFDSNIGNCTHHCSPTCHPAQVGPDWKYGCRHPAWPQNKFHDFVPIVECNGDKNKCELLKEIFYKRYMAGLKIRIKNTENKLIKLKNEIYDNIITKV